MKLVLSIIHDEDAFLVMDDLSDRGFSVTKLASTGGFLRSGNTTLICGVNDDKVNEVIDIIEKKCKSRKQITSISSAQSSKDNYIPFPVEVTVGGATIFVLDVEEFKKI
jgi:uncharacterized protein YaaQ